MPVGNKRMYGDVLIPEMKMQAYVRNSQPATLLLLAKKLAPLFSWAATNQNTIMQTAGCMFKQHCVPHLSSKPCPPRSLQSLIKRSVQNGYH